MADSIRIATLALAGMSLLALPTATPSQSSQAPRSVAMCLPAVAAAPVPCGPARAGQTIRLQIATTSLPTGPIRLLFAEESASGQAPRTASVIVPSTRSIDGGYDVPVPGELCAGRGRAAGNFEIQHLMSTYNQTETISRSLGTVAIAC